MSGTMPNKCPACGHNLQICLLHCQRCGTEVQGDFSPGRFAQLTDEQLAFLETFIRCRGNLKDVCGVIGISYPTARNRLDQLIEAMNFENRQAASVRRLEILERLKEGLITTEEALEKLQEGNEK